MEPSSRSLCLVCTRKEVCNLLNRTLCRKHVAAQRGNERDRDLTHVRTRVNGWHKTGMLQQYQLATHHVTTWSCCLIIIRTHQTSKLTGSLPCMHITFTNAYINMPWENYSSKHAKHSSYQRFKHACLVRRLSSSAKFASRLPPPVSTY